MEVFASGANNIVNIISKYSNNNINNKELNRNLLTAIIFNYYYFKKDEKKIIKEKEVQQQLYCNFLIQEEKQIKNEKIHLSKERNIKRKEDICQKYNNEKKLLLDNYKEKKNFTKIIEPTFDCYIPVKQYSIPIEFYHNKIVSNIFEDGPGHGHSKNDHDDLEDNIQNNFNIEQSDKKVIINGDNSYNIDIPIHLCDNNNNNFFFDDDSFNEMGDKNDIKEFNGNTLLNILETDDKLLFYEDEKMDLEHKKESIYNQSNKIILPIKKANSFVNIELDKNLSKNEIVDNHYKEFSCYLSLSIYTKYIKKTNYIFLHLILMNYFELEEKINTGLDLYKDTIIITHVKKFLLQSGICTFSLYDKIIKNILNQKEDFCFENYLLFFSPIFKVGDELQSYKFKFLLNLCKNKYSEIMTQLEFDMFLNLIKGKKMCKKEIYSDLMKRFKIIYNKKYPNENQKQYYIFTHVLTILEFIIDLNCDNLSDFK